MNLISDWFNISYEINNQVNLKGIVILISLSDTTVIFLAYSKTSNTYSLAPPKKSVVIFLDKARITGNNPFIERTMTLMLALKLKLT